MMGQEERQDTDPREQALPAPSQVDPERRCGGRVRGPLTPHLLWGGGWGTQISREGRPLPREAGRDARPTGLAPRGSPHALTDG